MSDQSQIIKNKVSHWRYSCRWVACLSVVALVFTILPIFFAKDLATQKLFGWPLPFFLVAFGLPLFYLLIIALYAWVMDVRERNNQ